MVKFKPKNYVYNLSKSLPVFQIIIPNFRKINLKFVAVIRLYNYRNNFGDDLSPYIISKLSGDVVVYRKPFSTGRFLLDFFRFLKKLIFKNDFDKSLLMYSPFKKVIISIGSILEESTPNSIIWGSGLGSKDISIKGGQFLAVRGPLSQKRLFELGYKVPNVIGDPAILLPLVYPKEKYVNTKRYKFGIVPHKSDYQDILNYLMDNNFSDILLIDLVNPELEDIINCFLSCDKILSSSLHGLIVAHSYSIPAILFEKNKLFGDGSKFADYLSSVGISPYQAISFSSIEFSKSEELNTIFKKYSNFYLPKVDITHIQSNLIKVAPFNVLNKYKNIISKFEV